MRTTVTIDADTEHLLRDEAIRTGHSFDEVMQKKEGIAVPPLVLCEFRQT